MTDTRKAPERIWAEERDAPCIYYDTSVKNSGKYQVEYIRANLATPDLTAAAEAMAEALEKFEYATQRKRGWGAYQRMDSPELYNEIGEARMYLHRALAKYNAVKEGLK